MLSAKLWDILGGFNKKFLERKFLKKRLVYIFFQSFSLKQLSFSRRLIRKVKISNFCYLPGDFFNATADILTKLLQQCFLFFIGVVIPGQ